MLRPFQSYKLQHSQIKKHCIRRKRAGRTGTGSYQQTAWEEITPEYLQKLIHSAAIVAALFLMCKADYSQLEWTKRIIVFDPFIEPFD